MFENLLKIENCKLKIVFTLLFFFLCVNTASAATTISKSLSRPVNELGLVGWWTFDGPDMLTNVADKSGQGNNGSLIHGGSGTTTAPGPIGQALSFDGSNDNITTPNTNFPDTSSSDYSVSMWVKPSSIPAGSNPRIFAYATDSNNGFKVAFGGANCTGNFIFEPKKSSINYGGCGTTTTFSVNTWYHLVGVFTSSTNTATFYVNSVVKTTSVFAGGLPSTTGVGYIGVTNAASYFPGALDDLRLYNRALSAAEVLRLYQIGATSKIAKSLPGRDSLKSGLVGWWTFDGPDMLTNVADKSGQGNTGRLLHSGSGTTTAPGRVGQALDFDGTDDYVNVGQASSLNFGTGSFTFSAWVKAYPVQGAGGTVPAIINKSSGDLTDTSGSTGWILTWYSVDYCFILNDGAANGDQYCFQNSIGNDNVWRHVVVTVSTSAIQGYVNGVATGVATSRTRTGSTDTATDLNIGRWREYSREWRGSLDDVRTYNRALSASEVLQLYQLGATSKIAKTLPGRDSLTSGLVGWWTFDGPDMLTNVADRSGQGNNGKLIHAGSGTTTAPGPIGQALSFDGTDDYVTIRTATPIIPYGTYATTTQSVWVYSKGANKDTGTEQLIFGEAMNGVDNNFVYGLYYGSAQLYFAATNGTGGGGQYPYSNANFYNKWHHLVQTFDGTDSDLYIDGVWVADGSAPVARQTPSANFMIGEAPYLPSNLHFNGIIDDMRIYNRVLSAAEVLQLYNLGR